MVYNEESTNEVHTIQVSIDERKETITRQGRVCEPGRDGPEDRGLLRYANGHQIELRTESAMSYS